MRKLEKTFASINGTHVALAALVLAVGVGVAAFGIGSASHARTVASFEKVDAVVVGDPEITYRGRYGTPAVIADIRHGESTIASAVPTQAKLGDSVVAYVDAESGELFRATTAGQLPYANNVLPNAIFAAALAVPALIVALGILYLAADLVLYALAQRPARRASSHS